jgi:hypothetical protein
MGQQTLIEASGPVTLKEVKGKSKISPNGCVLRVMAKHAAVRLIPTVSPLPSVRCEGWTKHSSGTVCLVDERVGCPVRRVCAEELE